MSYEKDLITFKVDGENIINEIINFTYPLLIEEFKPYLNNKVLKIDNYLLKEIEQKTEKILNKAKEKFKDISIIYLKADEYNIQLKIQLRFNDKTHFFYYDGYKYICAIEKQNIKSFYDFKPLENISLKEQLKTFENCLNILEQLKKEKEKLKPYSLNEHIK